MIEVNNVIKSFDGFCALNGVSLHVEKGSVFGLVGPNGAGKTTLLKIIAGVYKQDDGGVFVKGEPIFDNTKIKESLFFISDDFYFFPTYSIIETAKYYASIYKNWSWERYNNLKSIFGIDEKRRIRQLSKGMQKQVAFWMAISSNADIILLDEPVDGLDPVMRRNVLKIIMQDIAERETTVLVSSHNLRELEEICDHVGIMHDGKIALSKALDDIKGTTHKLQLAFANGFPAELEDKLKPVHSETFGSVQIVIVKGDEEEILRVINQYNPILVDMLPLTLEEVFIYELGGLGYEMQRVIL